MLRYDICFHVVSLIHSALHVFPLILCLFVLEEALPGHGPISWSFSDRFADRSLIDFE